MSHQKLRLPSGDEYEGEVLDGKPHGRGKLTYPNGRVFEGEFRDNRFVGKP